MKSQADESQEGLENKDFDKFGEKDDFSLMKVEKVSLMASWLRAAPLMP